MTAPAELSFERTATRIGRIAKVVGVLGTCVAWAVGGWKVGAGFLLGSVLSAINYHWLHKLVVAIGRNAKPQFRSIILGFRYLILGGVAYVILKVSPISLPALLAGLFVLTAAVFIEVIFEFYYARK